MFLIFIMLLGNKVSLDLQSEVKLDTNDMIEETSDRMLVNDNGDIWLFSYWNAKISMFNANGTFKMQVSEAGDGPGEIREPFFAMPFSNRRFVMVFEGGQPMAHVFDFKTGRFIKRFRKFQPANKWVTNGNEFISLNNGIDATKLWTAFDLELKVKNKFGIKDMIPRFEFLSRRFALALDKEGNVYYQEGSEPSVRVYKNGSDFFSEWKLKVPEHYRAFQKPMDTRKSGFSRNKSYDHMSSFTHLNSLAVLDNKYLMIEWLLWIPSLKSLDFYDINTKELLLLNFRNDATLLTANGNRIFILIARDDEKTDDKHLFRSYLLHE